jgi:hypothetical protein
MVTTGQTKQIRLATHANRDAPALVRRARHAPASHLVAVGDDSDSDVARAHLSV